MRKIIFILITLTVVTSSCRYEEGPAISFRSVYSRLLGEWEVTEYTSDGIDSLQYYKDSCGCGLNFPQPQSSGWEKNFWFFYCKNADSFIVPFEYSLSKNKKTMSVSLQLPEPDIEFTSFGPMLTHIEWKILRLTKEEFKISATANGHNYVVKFKKRG